MYDALFELRQMATNASLPSITAPTTDTNNRPVGSRGYVLNETTSLVETWIWVHNDTAVAWVTGNIIMRNAGETTYECGLCTASLNPQRVAGVAQAAVAAGEYAWILRDGVGEVLAGAAGITANTELIPGVADGVSVDCAAVTNASFGISTEVAAGGALATSRVVCNG